ncbi:related to Virulence protein STM3117 [Phialocephala subalpina]|uniref:Related to Virulence protein STM3117 n=1 Tax=Phialocephala subalpina TaxID=576137 RepID=A0A1L7XFN4_9HELO|nr:related to Virulence protein STM3117 [Phialocephala subalpina]
MSSSTSTSTPLSKQASTITSLDHLVLTVKNIEKTKEWYTKNLGMRHEAFVSASTPDITRHSLIFGSQKINLHESGHEFEPKALNVQPGSGDLCFLTSDPISEVRKRLIEAGVEMVDLGGEGNDLGFGEGIVKRTGARGTLASVYCRDLDGNLVE